MSPVTESTKLENAVTTAAIPFAASHMPAPIISTIAPNVSIAGIAASRAGPNLANAITSNPIAIAIPASTPTANPPPSEIVLAALDSIHIPAAHNTIAPPNANIATDIAFSFAGFIELIAFVSTTRPTPSSPIAIAIPANTPIAPLPDLASITAALAIM